MQAVINPRVSGPSSQGLLIFNFRRGTLLPYSLEVLLNKGLSHGRDLETCVGQADAAMNPTKKASKNQKKPRSLLFSNLLCWKHGGACCTLFAFPVDLLASTSEKESQYRKPSMLHSMNSMVFSVKVPVLSENTYST